MNKDIFELCQRFAKKENVEFIFEDNYSNNVKILKYDISKVSNQESSGLLVRAIVNGFSGYTTITEITEKNIKVAIEKAKKIAKLKKGVKIKDFGGDKSSVKIKQDKKIIDFDISEKFSEIKKNLTKEKYFKSYEGHFGARRSYAFYVNPYTSKEETSGFVIFGAQINTFDKKASSGGESQIFSKAKDINLIDTIDKAKTNAKNTLNPIQGEKGEYTIVFSADATASIISSFIVVPTIGELMFKKQTYLSDSFGKNIFSKNLTITEEPHKDYFLGSETLDDEGFKTSKKTIIDNGVFKTAIYDQEYSVLSGKKQTGNGFRESIYSPVSCDFTNLVVTPGKEKQDDIISRTKKGIYVYDVMGIHTSNMTNGEFSLVINSGKEIVGGKYKNTITNLNFTGNCKTIFKDIYFSREQKFFGSALMPSMVMAKVKLI